MRMQLIFPPQFEPFQPYLSLPYLKALLKIYGYHSTCFDANGDFYWWLFKRAKVKNFISCPNKQYLNSNISRAIEIIRSIPKNLADYRWAINVADGYLKAISPAGVKISLTSLTIGNKYCSNDLLKYTKDENNIFKSYFTDSKKYILGDSETNIYFFSVVVLDQLAAALTFAREIKLRRPDSIIVVGGPLISHIYQRLNKIAWIHNLFDIITPKEGNQAIKDIFKLDYSYNGHITPDFSDLQLDKYFSCQTVLPYLVTHGCRWGRCVFCSHHLSYKHFRESDMKSVISDISQLQKKYGVKYISFSDEYLTSHQLEELSDLIMEKGMDIKWSTFVRAEPKFVDRKFTKKLYEAGCRLLMFGFESASQKILNSMKKGTQAKYYPDILRSCKEANIAIRLDFMLGFPNESEKDVQKTLSFIKNNKEFIDTHFSSYSVAVFELREGAPILNGLEKYSIKLINPLRGDLDNQFEFVDKIGISSQQKKEWREKMIGFIKNELSAELISPQNKTHQLILKDLYDDGYFELPITKIIPANLHKLEGRWSPSVEIYSENSHLRVKDYSTGGELLMSQDMAKLIKEFTKNVNLESVFQSQKVLNRSIFIKLLKFLQRNDYIEILYKEENEKYYSLNMAKEAPMWPAL